ncbi:hypothetical protein EGYY_10710 [Eggerthella sp. YY7918]|nr:hypothetical protein EGYY_10710 [Eggerthella sp. YY7918]
MFCPFFMPPSTEPSNIRTIHHRAAFPLDITCEGALGLTVAQVLRKKLGISRRELEQLAETRHVYLAFKGKSSE